MAKRTTAGRAAAATGSDEAAAHGSEGEYARFLPLGQKLAPAVIQKFRGDAELIAHNVGVGLAAIGPHEAELRVALPKLDHAAVQTLDGLAAALLFAHERIDARPRSTGEIAERLKRARELRKILLDAARSLATSRVIPARLVQKIEEGKGPLDVANDCTQLAALFGAHAKIIKNKTAVSAAEVKEAALVGAELTTTLKPVRAKRSRAATGTTRQQMDERDRLWTLLVLRHRDLRRAGMWLWGDEVDSHVPRLQAYQGRTRPASTAPAAPTP